MNRDSNFSRLSVLHPPQKKQKNMTVMVAARWKWCMWAIANFSYERYFGWPECPKITLSYFQIKKALTNRCLYFGVL